MWVALLCREYLLSGVPLLLLTLEHWSFLLIVFRGSELGGTNTGRVEGIWRDQEIERKQREIGTAAGVDLIRCCRIWENGGHLLPQNFQIIIRNTNSNPLLLKIRMLKESKMFLYQDL